MALRRTIPKIGHGVSEKYTMRRCSICGYRLTLETDIWRRIETARGMHFKLKHRPKVGECGGQMVALVSRIGGES